jgi:hypothetical protein
MSFSQRELALMTIAAGLGVLAAILVMRGTGSYEQCILDEMRGQAGSPLAAVNAVEVCTKRFGPPPN